jgi:thiamine-monophosphate kinase
MRETELIRKIREIARQKRHPRWLQVGIGDDCAVMTPRRNRDLVFTSDYSIEGRHFTVTTHSAADIGHKALARSLSDLAAMGADPLFCLVSLAISADRNETWIKSFYKGLTALGTRFGLVLAGGDLAKGERITVDVMCCGDVPRGSALLRSGSQPGDDIFVTGELGAAAYGLLTKRGESWNRQKRPEPRVGVGRKLRRLAHAAIDLSDGLSLDLRRLCEESGVGARLEGKLPIAKRATLEQALHGGEDYELLFTAAKQSRVPPQIAGIAVTRIGQVTNEVGKISFEGSPLEPLGFDHFR